MDCLFFAYLALAPIYYFFNVNPNSENKPIIILKMLSRNINHFLSGNIKISTSKKEKIALLFFLVKLFFIPVMYNFVINNLISLKVDLLNFYWYSFALTLMFTMDTVIFSFGYSFEFKSLKNVVRSVEPTLFGWVVALVCYPPFNQYIGGYVPWGANEYIQLSNPNATLILQIVVVILLMIYTWATVSLGSKASIVKSILESSLVSIVKS